MLAWSTSGGANGTRRTTERWTYAGAGSEPVRYEEDRGGAGTVYRFDCAP